MSDFIWDELEPEPQIAIPEIPDEVPPSLHACVPGDLIRNDSGSVYVCTRAYPLTCPDADAALVHDPGMALARLAPTFPGLPDFGNLRSGDCAFLDSETTGLGYNAVPFMIGVGTFERPRKEQASQAASSAFPSDSRNHNADEAPTHFVVRQLFAHHPRHESAVLQHLQELLAGKPVCVSFNGNRFDIPLIRSRFETSRYHFPELPLADPFETQPPLSLDLLPLARKIWRRRIGSCALSNCEARILGLQRTHADVDGAQIPGIYLQYLHSGKADEVGRVFYHNRQDIVSMSFLLRSLVRCADSATSRVVERLSGEEALSLGMALLREARWSDAERLLVFATRALDGSDHHAVSFKALALHYKRQKRWREATETWERWLSTTVQDSVDPYVELAKYYEWRAKDIGQAEMYTRWALHVHRSAPRSHRAQRIQADLEYRLRRLERKKASAKRISD